MDPNQPAQAPADPYAHLSDEQLMAIAQGQPAASPAQAPEEGGFTQFIKSAGDIATVGRQGIIQGLSNASTGINVGFREITDSMGLTDPKATDLIRQVNANQQAKTDSVAKERGLEGLSTGAQITGEIAPMLMTGGAAIRGVTAILGGGKLAGIVAGGAVSGAQSFLADPQADLATRQESGIYGSILGTTLGTVSTLASKLVGKVKIDPAKADAFRSAGMTRTPIAQLMDDSVPPMTKRFYEGVVNTLNKIPIFGIKNPVAGETHKFFGYTKSVVNELDDPTIKATKEAAYAELKKGIPESAVFDVSRVASTAKGTLKNLGANPAIEIREDIGNMLTRFGNVQRLGFHQLWDVRQALDYTIKNIKSGANKADRNNLNALYGIRRSITETLEDSATRSGSLKSWKVANQAVQDDIVAHTLSDAIKASSNSTGNIVNPQALSKNLKGAFEDLKEAKLVINNATHAKSISNLTKITDSLADSSTKAGIPGFSGNLQGVGMIALGGIVGTGAAIGASTDSTTTGIASTLAIGLMTKGLGKMVTTPTGRVLLSKLGNPSNLNNPHTRVILSSALAIGQADHEHSKEVQARTEANDQFGHMSTEELMAIATGQSGQQPAAMGQPNVPIQQPQQLGGQQ